MSRIVPFDVMMLCITKDIATNIDPKIAPMTNAAFAIR